MLGLFAADDAPRPPADDAATADASQDVLPPTRPPSTCDGDAAVTETDALLNLLETRRHGTERPRRSQTTTPGREGDDAS